MRMRRTLCNFLAAFFSLLIVMPCVMMLLDRELPVRLEYGTIPSGHINAPVTVTWHATRMRKFGDGWFSCHGSFYRRVTDSGGFITESKPLPIESVKLLGDKETGFFHKEVLLPPMLAGEATYQVYTTYWCNPIQKYFWPIIHMETSIHFTVLPDPK